MIANLPILIFDTTLRDGELTPGVHFSTPDKVQIAQQLEEIGVDTIEIGYPGRYAKDIDEIIAVSQVIKGSTLCALAGSQETEINKAAKSLEKAEKSSINIYTLVNLTSSSKTLDKNSILSTLKKQISQAKNYCNIVQWTAFDATRGDINFLCEAVQTAIESGAKIISIPDSLGVALPEDFYNLLQKLYQNIPQLQHVTVSVHCHNDLGKAVENSLVGLEVGVRQIECAVNGLGARKGNANLTKVVNLIQSHHSYYTTINHNLIPKISELIK
ncbi:2-isopropylmalate synthase [Lyngbya sp. PCC 8106]|uniref:2-isopropylmalate synthase n=1 Tax=Lyngbya sp. (strain PCC 8106) TaxID=313612 RepID=UPI0000EA9B30|nr:2-isopropylmalate synthase [Lyngbya sp. PCC 8106]EAW35798.1 2-isopropylmalate synthase [Lyngbya sp. PCC 8106]